jgi:hypothetical protein
MFELDELISFDNTSTKKDVVDPYINFDKTTKQYYKIMRELHLDPITYDKVPDDLAFKFEYMWDPLTGERTQKDPNGPLYFNVKNLIKNFYYNRLRMLWIDGDIVNGLQYQGYYGDGVGAGEELINGRGANPHLHLFRLPIIDCYIPKDFNTSIITMGAKLTNEEINSIQEIYNKFDKKNKKSNTLIIMKNLYEASIKQIKSDDDYYICIANVEKLKRLQFIA